MMELKQGKMEITSEKNEQQKKATDDIQVRDGFQRKRWSGTCNLPNPRVKEEKNYGL